MPLNQVNEETALKDPPLSLRKGDFIIVEKVPLSISQQQSRAEVPFINNSTLTLRAIPDDNSCLFHAVSVASTGTTCEQQSTKLRECMY